MRKSALLFCLLSAIPLFAADPMLIGGRPALKGELPEIVYIASGGARCSAVLVSENVLITAAHCVADRGSVEPVGKNRIDFVHEQKVYTAVCHQAPLYRDQIEDHDLALCKLDKRVSIKPAKVDKEPLKVDETVLLTGYGCIDGSRGGVGGNDGILRVGKARITKLPKDRNHWFYTEANTRLCFGDRSEER